MLLLDILRSGCVRIRFDKLAGSRAKKGFDNRKEEEVTEGIGSVVSSLDQAAVNADVLDDEGNRCLWRSIPSLDFDG